MRFSVQPHSLNGLRWQYARLHEALDALAQQCGFVRESISVPPPSQQRLDFDRIQDWLNVVAAQMDLEMQPVQAAASRTNHLTRAVAPAILYLPDFTGHDSGRFIVVYRSGRIWSQVIAPDLSLHRVRTQAISTGLRQVIEAPYTDTISSVLNEIGIAPERLERVRDAILSERLSQVPVRAGWMLRLMPGRSLFQQMSQAGIIPYLVGLPVVYSLEQLLLIIGWVLIGSLSLGGQLDTTLLTAWALINLTALPVALAATWFQDRIASDTGMLLKRRLLYGTLQLQPEEVRHQGMGQFLGRVLDSEAIEQLTLNSGLLSITALIQLVLALPILASGAGGPAHALLLLLWMLVALLLSLRYAHRNRHWLNIHRDTTGDLVERMIGHRTRLAQESPRTWHQQEDDLMTRYLIATERQDRAAVQLKSMIERGWLALGMAGLAGVFITGSAPAPQLALSVGGIILASRALATLSGGIISITGALNVRDQVAPLYHAAARQHPPPDASVVTGPLSDSIASDQTGTALPVLDAREISFSYGTRTRPILDHASLTIQPGDRLLLEGPSGAGKSTLAALLTGLRQPDSGLLMLAGFDRQTLGEDAWRQRIVTVPQFHENHILTETMAFNLLMGSTYPPTRAQLERAHAICEELGLRPLLERMPAGLLQTVGESGWQLSHGERSRLYIARALLQDSDLIILDESFGALDPENRQRALETVLKRAKTLLVIAHP